eukprot:330026_1
MASIDSKTEHDDDVKEKQEKIEFKMSDSVRTLRLFVPGRICLFGEHSDWAGSYRRIDPNIQKGRCIVCGTNQGIYANVQAHSSKLICISTNERGNKLTGNDYFECNMDLNELYSIAQSGNTYSYVAGVAYQILLKHRIGGLIVNNYSTTLPLKKGLSSSAAICVLIARAFNKIYGLKLTIEGEMEYAYLGERTTPSQCGRMDQCCAYGSRPVSMEFDKDNVISKELQFGSTSSSLYLVIVDLNKGKDTKTILSDLNKCYSKEKQNDNISINVRKLLGEKNLDITSRAIEAIAHGNIDIVGKLMTEAQELFRKYAAPASPIQLKSEWLYKLLSFNKISKYIYGGKGVGSQGDGACQLLCKSATDQNIVCNIIENEFKGMQCIKLTIGGYQKITKCVIPTANYGSSLFPSSKCISTALFPIIDHCDGLLKPAILILCEQVIKCDINEIYLIVSPHDLQSFESLFYSKLPLEQIEKLSPELQRYYAKILSDGRKIKFIIQKEQLGLGHAVYEARKYINSDKFLLLLGDHLYKTKDCNQLSCIQQLVNYYKKNGCNCYGLQITHQNDIQNFGTISGKWLNNGSDNLNTKKNDGAVYITEIIEKPNIEYAIKHLQMDGLGRDEFLTIFGLYILDGARLCELIGNNINHKPPIRHNGKFQLTPCLQLLRKEQETHGIIINGLRFDIGTSPEKYVDVVNNFHRNNGHSSVNTQKSLHENDNNNNNNNANYSSNNLLLSKIDNLL